MSRFCFNCGKEINDSAMFCPSCGIKQMPPVNPNQNTVAPVPAQQYYQEPSEPPKNNKTAVTLAVCAIILCVALVAAFVVLIATGTLSFDTESEENQVEVTEKATESITDRTYSYNIENNGSVTKPESPTNNIIDNPSGSIPYTKGEVRNGEYINEWAGFKFKVTSDYPEADAATYNTLNSQIPAGEYGFIALNQVSGTVLSISYEDNTMNASLEEVFEYSIDLAKSMLESYNPITYSEINTINLCGEEYIYSTMYYSVSDIYGLTLMRMLNGKLVTIVITGETLSQCYSFLNTFEAAYPSV